MCHSPRPAPGEDEPLPPVAVDADWVAAGASNGRLLCFPLAEVKEGSGGKGAQLIKLDEADRLTTLALFDGQSLVVTGAARGKTELRAKLAGETLGKYKGKRARRGTLLHRNLVPTRLDGGAG